MPSPETMTVFMPWSRIWRMMRPPSVCRPPHIRMSAPEALIFETIAE